MEDMAGSPEIDVAKVMEQIRENVRKRRQEFPPSEATSPPPTGQMAVDLTSLRRGYAIYPVHFTSHRRVVGHFVVLVKKLLQKLLTPILERQLAYNAANTRVTSHLWEQATALQALQQTVTAQLEELGQKQAAVEAVGQRQADALQALRVEVAGVQQRQADALQAEVAGVQQQVDALQALRVAAEQGATEREAQMVAWERTVARLKTEVLLQERRITMLLEEARKRLPAPWGQDQVQRVADEAHHVLDALYVSFEDEFRGTRAEIKERCRVYLALLQQSQLGTETRPVLDVGCGRGEWLELLQEEGLWGQGVDRNRVLIEQCRRRGLEVIESDVLTYLHSLPDASVGAVTGFHIIEHWPLEVLIAVLDETVRVLTSGGVAIFETPNPRNVLVGSHTFYLDPTHRNPIPSSVMQFLAEARGLCRVEILELHPYPKAARVQDAELDVAQRFNEYFYGPQDYAVVGWKA